MIADGETFSSTATKLTTFQSSYYPDLYVLFSLQSSLAFLS